MLRAIQNSLVAEGLGQGTDLVVSGCSAGGLVPSFTVLSLPFTAFLRPATTFHRGSAAGDLPEL